MGSTFTLSLIHISLPEFMKKADLIFVDPPWNLSNINTFYTKANRRDYLDNFEMFYKRLFDCIKEINPRTCYVEIGKQYLADFIIEMRKLYKYVTFYNSTYYRDNNRLCYVIRGSNNAKKPSLDGMDEEDIIKWVCKNEDYSCIGAVSYTHLDVYKRQEWHSPVFHNSREEANKDYKYSNL